MSLHRRSFSYRDSEFQVEDTAQKKENGIIGTELGAPQTQHVEKIEGEETVIFRKGLYSRFEKSLEDHIDQGIGALGKRVMMTRYYFFNILLH